MLLALPRLSLLAYKGAGDAAAATAVKSAAVRGPARARKALLGELSRCSRQC
jgi:hypothetical protein